VAEVVPFFPFTEFERMVVVQQELLNLKQNLAKPDNQKIGRTFGNITIKLQDQPQVWQHCCFELAEVLRLPKPAAKVWIQSIRHQTRFQLLLTEH